MAGMASLDDVNAVLTVVLGKPEEWHTDWKLWSGLFLWFGALSKWLRHGYQGLYWVKAIYTIGYNLTILHLVQQYGTTGLHVSFATLLFQTMLSTYVFWKPRDLMESKSFTASSLYEDIGGSALQVLFLFIGQLSLLLMYCTALFRACDTDTRNYVHWIVAYFAVQMSAFFNRGSSSQLGPVWDGALWQEVLQIAGKANFSCAVYGGKVKTFHVSRGEMIVRGLMGFTVNSIFREALAFTVPVMLMFVSDPFEFVGSCLALNFIVTLDDMEAKEYLVVDAPPALPAETFSDVGKPQEATSKYLCHLRQKVRRYLEVDAPPALPAKTISDVGKSQEVTSKYAAKSWHVGSMVLAKSWHVGTVVPGQLQDGNEPHELV